jgi:hypothetical protein
MARKELIVAQKMAMAAAAESKPHTAAWAAAGATIGAVLGAFLAGPVGAAVGGAIGGGGGGFLGAQRDNGSEGNKSQVIWREP